MSIEMLLLLMLTLLLLMLLASVVVSSSKNLYSDVQHWLPLFCCDFGQKRIVIGQKSQIQFTFKKFENISSWWEIDKVESLYRKKIKVRTFIDDGLYSHSSGFAGNIESENIKQRYNRNEERIEKVTSNLPFKRWTSC